MKSEHSEKIESINININSNYFTTTSKDVINIWSINTSNYTSQKIIGITIDNSQEEKKGGQGGKNATRTLATVDSDCKVACVYRGRNFMF